MPDIEFQLTGLQIAQQSVHGSADFTDCKDFQASAQEIVQSVCGNHNQFYCSRPSNILGFSTNFGKVQFRHLNRTCSDLQNCKEYQAIWSTPRGSERIASAVSRLVYIPAARVKVAHVSGCEILLGFPSNISSNCKSTVLLIS